MSAPVTGRPSPAPEPPRLQSPGQFLRNVALLVIVPLAFLGVCTLVLKWLHVM